MAEEHEFCNDICRNILVFLPAFIISAKFIKDRFDKLQGTRITGVFVDSRSPAPGDSQRNINDMRSYMNSYGK